jgi:hypothetical protein
MPVNPCDNLCELCSAAVLLAAACGHEGREAATGHAAGGSRCWLGPDLSHLPMLTTVVVVGPSQPHVCSCVVNMDRHVV